MLLVVHRFLAALDIECWELLGRGVQETSGADFHRVGLSILLTIRRPLAGIEIMARAHKALVMAPSTRGQLPSPRFIILVVAALLPVASRYFFLDTFQVHRQE